MPRITKGQSVFQAFVKRWQAYSLLDVPCHLTPKWSMQRMWDDKLWGQKDYVVQLFWR